MTPEMVTDLSAEITVGAVVWRIFAFASHPRKPVRLLAPR